MAAAAVGAAAAAPVDRGHDDVSRPAGVTAAPAKAQRDAGGRERPNDGPTDDPIADPSWALPAARGGGRVRRVVWAGVAAMLLVGVLVASAAARGRSPEPSGGEATTPPTVNAVEAPQQPDTEDRRPERSAGGVVQSGGGSGSSDAGDGGGDTGTGTVEPPPPTETATDPGDTDTGDAGAGDAGATEDPDTTGDAGGNDAGDGVDADAPVGDAGDGAAGPDGAAAAEAQGASADGAAGQDAAQD